MGDSSQTVGTPKAKTGSRKSQGYFTSSPHYPSSGGSDSPHQACEEAGPLALGPQPTAGGTGTCKASLASVFLLEGNADPDPPSLILQRGASASWPPARLFPPGHHHSCPTLLGNPALSPGPGSVPTAHPGSIAAVALRLSPPSPSSLHLQLSSCPQKCWDSSLRA